MLSFAFLGCNFNLVHVCDLTGDDDDDENDDVMLVKVKSTLMNLESCRSLLDRSSQLICGRARDGPAQA